MDSEIRITYQTSTNRAPVGDEISIGRAATVAMGGNDRHLPAVACVLECAESSWNLWVLDHVKLWVDVLIAGHRVWSGSAGTRAVFTAPRAVIRMRTVSGSYEVAVRWTGRPAERSEASGKTVALVRVLLPTEPNDRAWIIACRDRLEDWNHPSLSSSEIAEALGQSVNTVDQRLSRSKERIADAMRQAGFDNDGSRDSYVDWLVSTGAVDETSLEAAITLEGAS